MTTVEHFSDTLVTRYANIRMANGDPCYISIARRGILVKRSRLGILGAKLYEEKNAYHAAMTAKALAYLHPDRITPQNMTNPILVAFNAVLHCSTAGNVAVVLNTAVSEAEKRAGQPIADIVTGWENVE